MAIVKSRADEAKTKAARAKAKANAKKEYQKKTEEEDQRRRAGKPGFTLFNKAWRTDKEIELLKKKRASRRKLIKQGVVEAKTRGNYRDRSNYYTVRNKEAMREVYDPFGERLGTEREKRLYKEYYEPAFEVQEQVPKKKARVKEVKIARTLDKVAEEIKASAGIKERLFCKEYLKNGLVGWKAYKKVYVDDELAVVEGLGVGELVVDDVSKELERHYEAKAKNLLKDGRVKDFCLRYASEMASSIDVDVNYVLSGIKTVIERATAGEYDINVGMRGYELLGKYLNMFRDKVDFTANVKVHTLEEMLIRVEGDKY